MDRDDSDVYTSLTTGSGQWHGITSFPTGAFPSITNTMTDEFDRRLRELSQETKCNTHKMVNELYAKVNSLKYGIPINPDSNLKSSIANSINEEVKELALDLIETIDNDRTEEKLSGDPIDVSIYDSQVQKIKSLIDIYTHGMKNFKL